MVKIYENTILYFSQFNFSQNVALMLQNLMKDAAKIFSVQSIASKRGGEGDQEC